MEEKGLPSSLPQGKGGCKSRKGSTINGAHVICKYYSEMGNSWRS